MNAPTLVVDASLVVKWLVEEQGSAEAVELAGAWRTQGARLFAPALLHYEVTNVLFRRVLRGALSLSQAAALVDELLAGDLTFARPPGLHRHALEIASLLGLTAAYDAHYIALAVLFDCDLWTADQRLFRAASPRFPQVRMLPA